MKKDEIIDILRNNKEYLKKQYSVVKIGLFGSYADSSETENSDIDIYIELKDKKFKNIAGVWNYLESKLDKRVDLFYYDNKKESSIQTSIKQSVIYG